MIRHRLPLCIGLFLIAARLFAVTLSEADFVAGIGDVDAWGINSVGGVWARPAGEPPAIFSPDARSWIFLQNNITPEREYARVRASAWIYGNAPERTLIVIADGVAWGGAVRRSARKHAPPGQYAWRHVVSEPYAIREGGLISVALGYDYHYGGAWCQVGSIKVEAIVEGEAFPPLETAAPDLKPVLPDPIAKALAGEAIFTSAPVARFHTYDADTLVANAPADAVTTITTAVNAHEGMLFLLRNNSDEVQSFHLEFAGAAAPMVKLYRYLYEDGNPDRPQRVPADGMVEIGRRQTVGIEAVITTGEAAPGTYDGRLRIVPQNMGVSVREYTVTIEVLPLELPRTVPAIVGNWDYNGALDPDNLDFLLDARVNLFFLAQPSLEDLRAAVGNLKSRGLEPGSYKLLIEDWQIRAWDDLGERGRGWLGGIIATAKDLGLGYDDWILHVYDETFSEEFLKVARAIKEYDPNVRIFSDHQGDVATISTFAGSIDYWSPHQGQLLPYSAANTNMLEAMKQTGKPCMIYACDPFPTSTPLNYRLMPYQAFDLDLDGFAYWTAGVVPNRGHPGTARYGIAYARAAGKRQPSRRWFQWCAGIEDYLLLRMAVDADHEADARRLAREVLAARDTPKLFWQKVTAARRELMVLLQAD